MSLTAPVTSTDAANVVAMNPASVIHLTANHEEVSAWPVSSESV